MNILDIVDTNLIIAYLVLIVAIYSIAEAIKKFEWIDKTYIPIISILLGIIGSVLIQYEVGLPLGVGIISGFVATGGYEAIKSIRALIDSIISAIKGEE